MRGSEMRVTVFMGATICQPCKLLCALSLSLAMGPPSLWVHFWQSAGCISFHYSGLIGHIRLQLLTQNEKEAPRSMLPCLKYRSRLLGVCMLAAVPEP